MIFCPIVIRPIYLKWRRVVITLIFGIVFIFAAFKNEENQVIDYVERNDNFENAFTYNIDIADSKLFQNIINNAKDKPLQNSIEKMTKKEKSFKENEKDSYEKTDHLSILKEENEEGNSAKVYSKNNSIYHNNSSYIGSNHVKKKKHFCTVPSNIPPLLKQRHDHAMAACKRLKKHLPTRWRMRHIRWGKQLNIVYCHVPKAASTTWSWHLLRAIGVKDDIIAKTDSVHNLLKKYLPYPSVEDARKGVLDSALKFLVTRHPFERLVSAYQNKIADPLVEGIQYRKVQKQIISQYYGDLPVSSQPLVPSFRDFCRYVIDELEEWMQYSEKNGLNPPDHHWSPQTYICSPCKLKYDVFSDMSTLDWDTAFIAQQCGLTDVIGVNVQLNQSPPKPVSQSTMKIQHNQSHGQSVSQSPMNISNILLKQSKEEKNTEKYNKERNTTITERYIYGDNTKNEVELLENKRQKINIYKDYFDELNEREIKQLHHLYRFDFEIFGYDVQDYLTY